MTDIETWHPTQSPLAVDYTKSVLEEVRDQAVAGYRRLIRGGVEVGGILFGTREEGKIRVLATQPIACEYKAGPTFVLSEKDRLRLTDQLAASESVVELRGLAVVGWYVSHPRGEVALTDRDLEIFNEFFPAIWNVALVLKPNDKMVRCGFFVRESRGSLNVAQSYQEFELALPRSVEGTSAIRQIADQVSSSLAAQREPEAEPAAAAPARQRGASRREIVEMPSQPAQAYQSSSPGATVTGRVPQDIPRPFVPGGNLLGSGPAPVTELPPPAHWSKAVARHRSSIIATRQALNSRRLKWSWLVVWMLTVGAIIGGAYAYREFTAPDPLGLQVAEKDGELVIRWDAESRSVRWATTGKIEIQGSGKTKTEIDLTNADLTTGRYQYGGVVGDTSIRLSTDGKFGFHSDESTRYVSQLARSATVDAAAKPIDLRDRRKLQVEVLRMREELDKSQQRVKELESLLYNR